MSSCFKYFTNLGQNVLPHLWGFTCSNPSNRGGNFEIRRQIPCHLPSPRFIFWYSNNYKDHLRKYKCFCLLCLPPMPRSHDISAPSTAEPKLCHFVKQWVVFDLSWLVYRELNPTIRVLVAPRGQPRLILTRNTRWILKWVFHWSVLKSSIPGKHRRSLLWT